MSHVDPRRPTLTLRFRNEATLRILRRTAQIRGVSMAELAESAIEHELALLGADLTQKLNRTADLLRSYRGEGVEDDIKAFASAEVTIEDPFRTTQAPTKDALGIGAVFARSVEL